MLEISKRAQAISGEWRRLAEFELYKRPLLTPQSWVNTMDFTFQKAKVYKFFMKNLNLQSPDNKSESSSLDSEV